MPILHFFLKWVRRLLLTIWFWTGAAIATILTTMLVIATFAFSPRHVTHDSITFVIENLMAGMIMLWMELPGFWTLESYTVSNVKEETISQEQGPFILAANHNSIVDTLFIALLPYRKSYTYNAKYRFVPLFGQLCVLAGYVDIDTSNPEQRAKCVEKIGSKLQEGYSMMLYPEGTRNKTPKNGVQPEKLKSGMFRISSQYGVKIFPIRLVGTNEVLRPWGIVDSGTIKVIMAAPYVVPKEFDLDAERMKFAYIINTTPVK